MGGWVGGRPSTSGEISVLLSIFMGPGCYTSRPIVVYLKYVAGKCSLNSDCKRGRCCFVVPSILVVDLRLWFRVGFEAPSKSQQLDVSQTGKRIVSPCVATIKRF